MTPKVGKLLLQSLKRVQRQIRNELELVRRLKIKRNYERTDVVKLIDLLGKESVSKKSKLI